MISHSTPIDALYDPIKNEAMLAHAEFQTWDALYATHPARVALLNATASGFFAMLSPIIADHVMMRLSRLTDPSDSGKFRNLTLHDLTPILKASHIPSDATLYEEYVADLKVTCEGMRIQRNKRMAHLDFDAAAVNGADPLPGVRVTDIRRALAQLQQALNVFERNQQLPAVMYADFIHSSGPLSLLGSLKRTLAYKQHVKKGRIDPRLDDLELPQRAS